MGTASRLEEIKEQLSPEQLRFLNERAFCRSDVEAAHNTDLNPQAVYNWPEKQLINEAVRLILADGIDASRQILQRALADAARVKVAGLKSKKSSVAQASATEILDRFHGRPKQAIEATVTADIAVKGYMVISPDDWDEPDSGVSAAAVADSPVA